MADFTLAFQKFSRQLLILLIMIFPFSLAAQKNIEGKLTSEFNKDELNKIFKKYSVLEIDPANFYASIGSNKNIVHNISLSLEGLPEFQLRLHETNILSPDYELIVAGKKSMNVSAINDCRTFEGKLGNDPGSMVSLTISKNLLYGIFKGNGREYFIEPLRYLSKTGSINQYVVYETKDLVPNSGKTCAVNEINSKKIKREAIGGSGFGPEVSCRRVELTIASDLSMYEKYGSVQDLEMHNIATTNIMISIFNNTQLSNAYLNFALKGQYVSTSLSTEPYSPVNVANSIDSMLSAFRAWANLGNIDYGYDIAQLWSARETITPWIIGLGYLDGACNAYRYNVCIDFNSSGSSLATLSAHEIGHNLGARHDPYPWTIMYPSIQNPPASIFSNATVSEFIDYLSTTNCISDCRAPVPNILSPKTFCTEGLLEFQAQVTGNYTDVQWSFPGSLTPNSTQLNPVVKYLTPGPKIITLAAFNNFGMSYVRKTIIIETKPVDGALTGPASGVCQGSAAIINLQGNNPGLQLQEYHSPAIGWNAVGSFNNGSIIRNIFTNPTRFRAIVPNALCPLISNEILIAALPAPIVAISGPDNICSGGNAELQLSVNPSNTAVIQSVEWTPGFSTTQSINISPQSSSSYSVMVLATNGCSTNRTKHVFVEKPPAPFIAGGNDIALCSGSSATMQFTGTRTYEGCTSAANGQNPASVYTLMVNNGEYRTITETAKSGQFSLINVDAGKYYSFKSIRSDGSNADVIITISDASGNNILSTGHYEAIWKSTFTGQVRFYTHDQGCMPGSTNYHRSMASSSAISTFGSLLWMPGFLTTESITVIPGKNTNYILTFTNKRGCAANSSKLIKASIDLVEIYTSNILTNSAKLNWVSSITPAQWQVRFKKTNTGSQWSNPVTVNGSARSYILSGLIRNQDYQWQLKARCGNKWTEWSEAADFLTMGASFSKGISVDPGTSEFEVITSPNPSTDKFHIRVETASPNEKLQLQVTDQFGLIVETIRDLIPGKLIQIGERYRKGIYFVRIRQAGSVTTLKIVKL